MVLQRPDHPLTDRRKTGGQTEPFSKEFWKFLHAPRFVRPILLYGQNGPDRKNMAIMQNWPCLTSKIAKMQDGIKLRQVRSDLRQNDAGGRITSKNFRSDLGKVVAVKMSGTTKERWRHNSPPPHRKSRSQNAFLIYGAFVDASVAAPSATTSATNWRWRASENYCFLKYVMGKIEKCRLMAWQPHFKKRDNTSKGIVQASFWRSKLEVLASPETA